MTNSSDMTEPETAASRPSRGSSLPKILIALLLCGAVGGRAVYVWITSDNGFDFQRFAFMAEQIPDFYPVAGGVFFNDEPIDHGHLELWPVEDRFRADRIVGPIKSDGSFQVFTDIGGSLHQGVPDGTYKVTLMVYYPTGPLESPNPILPDEYYTAATTPITVTIKPDAGGTVLDIRETGEIQQDPRTERKNQRPGSDQKSDADGPSSENETSESN